MTNRCGSPQILKAMRKVQQQPRRRFDQPSSRALNLVAGTCYRLALELRRCRRRHRTYVRHGASKGAALLVIGLNRGIALAVMIAFGLVAVAVDGLVGGTVAAAIVGLAFGVVALACWAVFLRADISAALLLGAARLPGLRRPGIERHLAGLAGRLTQFGTMSPGGVALVLLLWIGHEILGAGVMWAFAQALGLELGFATIAWMRVAVQLVLILPLSIAGLGVRELTLVGLTTTYGIAPAAAVAWSLVIFAGTVAAALVGGALEAGSFWRRRGAEAAA